MPELVTCLLEEMGSLASADQFGFTPLQYAQFFGQQSVLVVLQSTTDRSVCIEGQTLYGVLKNVVAAHSTQGPPQDNSLLSLRKMASKGVSRYS